MSYKPDRSIEQPLQMTAKDKFSIGNEGRATKPLQNISLSPPSKKKKKQHTHTLERETYRVIVRAGTRACEREQDRKNEKRKMPCSFTTGICQHVLTVGANGH